MSVPISECKFQNYTYYIKNLIFFPYTNKTHPVYPILRLLDSIRIIKT
jgi:hypothetical protein